MFDNILDEKEVFKVGRITGLSCGKLILIRSVISIDLTNKSIEFLEENGKIPPSIFKFKPGDSGASVLDLNGKALGILYAEWIAAEYRYAIASPYFAVFEALKISLEL
ncbi:hypothetical protein Glove_120g179 [Diversispora epigaea]|uniref:Peptidase S1 domain-containing protein n=1 Tax=Diversispora epigaea TaxID=1348612 RepID=A0A397J9P9_9GLOM|nr:hypothetical protein Glove_120g179 [Diversispora epigaea]